MERWSVFFNPCDLGLGITARSAGSLQAWVLHCTADHQNVFFLFPLQSTCAYRLRICLFCFSPWPSRVHRRFARSRRSKSFGVGSLVLMYFLRSRWPVLRSLPEVDRLVAFMTRKLHGYDGGYIVVQLVMVRECMRTCKQDTADSWNTKLLHSFIYAPCLRCMTTCASKSVILMSPKEACDPSLAVQDSSAPRFPRMTTCPQRRRSSLLPPSLPWNPFRIPVSSYLSPGDSHSLDSV